MTDRGPFFFVPGFALTGLMWEPVIEAFESHQEATSLEVPDGLDFDAVAHSLAADRAGVWVGYSMGGRIALRIALNHPPAVRGLVLISATAGISDRSARLERRSRDESLARDIETRGVDWFLDHWLALPLFGPSVRGREDRITDGARIARQLRRLGQGVQSPDWSRLGELEVPVLLVAGELDPAYLATARALAEAIGSNASVAAVEGAGHAVVHERPRLVAELVTSLG